MISQENIFFMIYSPEIDFIHGTFFLWKSERMKSSKETSITIMEAQVLNGAQKIWKSKKHHSFIKKDTRSIQVSRYIYFA